MRRTAPALLLALAVLSVLPAEAEEPCVPAGRWRVPGAASAAVPGPDWAAGLARHGVVLLGETHDSPEHHRWQLQMLATLHAVRPNMVLAFEMFPRRVQPVLDAWVRGELDEKRFLEQVGWREVWSYEAAHYLPLFHFARMNRLPMVAMNVDQALVREVRRHGWSEVPAIRRDGVGDPAPALPTYREALFETFGRHGDKQPPKDSKEFARFVEAQLLWDRAMAEAIAKVRQGGGEPLVVGIVGQGHLQYGFGIPHQLKALGVSDAAVLIPWEADRACKELKLEDGTPVAAAVFGIDPAAEDEKGADKPKLGVMIETVEGGGVKIGKVVKDSIAEAAGLKADDVIIEAAGLALAKTGDLVAVVQRQAPGTWLPLKVKRGAETLDIVARFPSRP